MPNKKSRKDDRPTEKDFLKRRTYEEGRALMDAAHLAVQRLYCDALAFWRRCKKKPCRRHRRCSGNQTACLLQGLPFVPPAERVAAEKEVRAAPRGAAEPRIRWRSIRATLASNGVASGISYYQGQRSCPLVLSIGFRSISMSGTENAASLERSAINWRNARYLLFVHGFAALAVFPWFFSWTGVIVCIISYYVVGMLGVHVGYHRLFTHRSFSCPVWVERSIAILSCCCGQDSPAHWAARHRLHHHHSDDALDPHSPRHGFLWAHVGWLLVRGYDLDHGAVIDRYAKDLKRDAFHAALMKHDTWLFIMFASWIVYFVAGFAAAAVGGSSIAAAAQFGLSLMVWGAAVRTVIIWHVAWIVNSGVHQWGYRNYETPDGSRNNIWLGVFCNGDNWHNNHHADPRSARHGHKWWEFDLAWGAIRLMMALGLASDARLPSSASLAGRFSGSGSRPPLDDFAPSEAGSGMAPVPATESSTTVVA